MKCCTFGHGFSKDQKVQPFKSYHSKPGILSSSFKTWQIPEPLISFTPMHSSVLAQKLTHESGKMSRRMTVCIFVDSACVFVYLQATWGAEQAVASSLCRNNTWINKEHKVLSLFIITVSECLKISRRWPFMMAIHICDDLSSREHFNVTNFSVQVWHMSLAYWWNWNVIINTMLTHWDGVTHR